MPTYNYWCKTESCHHEFTEFNTISNMDAPTKTPCPKCGNLTVIQTPSAPALVDPYNVGVIKPPSEFTRDVLAPALKYQEHTAQGRKLMEKYKLKGS